MNWFSGASWFWKGLRGQSVTFAALFALGLLGVSVIRFFRHVLHALHAPWYLWLLLPIVIVSALARWERVWMPQERQRRQWSRLLIFGALGVTAALAFLTPKPAPPTGEPETKSAIHPRWQDPARR